MKKPLILLIAITFLVFAGACFTPQLYNQNTNETRAFEEKINTFLITADGNQIIVVGNQHHYIFNANKTLKFILQWQHKQAVTADFSSFRIDNNQAVTGSYNLKIKAGKKLSIAKRKLLISKGFTEHPVTKNLYYDGNLQGKRYLANAVKIPNTMLLNKTYTIQMLETMPDSATNAVKKILLTPLAIAADGLLILGGTPLLLLSLILD